jgi:hypothetical protein
MITGVNLTTTDVIAMLQLCSYETDALGYSNFCSLFTQDEFLDYEYYYDLSFVSFSLKSMRDLEPTGTPCYSTTTTDSVHPSLPLKAKDTSKNSSLVSRTR